MGHFCICMWIVEKYEVCNGQRLSQHFIKYIDNMIQVANLSGITVIESNIKYAHAYDLVIFGCFKRELQNRDELDVSSSYMPSQPRLIGQTSYYYYLSQRELGSARSRCGWYRISRNDNGGVSKGTVGK